METTTKGSQLNCNGSLLIRGRVNYSFHETRKITSHRVCQLKSFLGLIAKPIEASITSPMLKL